MALCVGYDCRTSDASSAIVVENSSSGGDGGSDCGDVDAELSDSSNWTFDDIIEYNPEPDEDEEDEPDMTEIWMVE